MYVIIVTAQVQPEHRDAFIAALIDDARGSVANEPGCLRFDVIQDEADPNRLYFYEVYRDRAAFDAHLQTPHFLRWRDTAKDWYAQPIVVYKGINVFPADDLWQPQTLPE